MSIRMRHTKSHSARRRSHHFLTAAAISVCEKCGKEKMPHKACGACGYYKGKEIINTLKKITKKEKNKLKSKKETKRN